MNTIKIDCTKDDFFEIINDSLCKIYGKSLGKNLGKNETAGLLVLMLQLCATLEDYFEFTKDRRTKK